MLSMPKPYPKEFRDDVVRVAEGRDGGVTLDEIASDFGIHPMTLSKWLRQARIDAGGQPGRTTADAAELAAARRRVHSDRGSQYHARKMKRCLDRHGLVGSMGQVGTAADNAAMESFFSLLQNNVLNRQRWKTRDELRIAIVTWIERTYHRRRRQTSLGRLTPIEYETIMTPTATKAA
jgi:transposase-like protein